MLLSNYTRGYVEVANLPNQVHIKSLQKKKKKDFEFTLENLGKSTLVNSFAPYRLIS